MTRGSSQPCISVSRTYPRRLFDSTDSHLCVLHQKDQLSSHSNSTPFHRAYCGRDPASHKESEYPEALKSSSVRRWAWSAACGCACRTATCRNRGCRRWSASSKILIRRRCTRTSGCGLRVCLRRRSRSRSCKPASR